MNPASEWEPERRGNQVIAAFINVIYHKGKGQRWELTRKHACRLFRLTCKDFTWQYVFMNCGVA